MRHEFREERILVDADHATRAALGFPVLGRQSIEGGVAGIRHTLQHRRGQHVRGHDVSLFEQLPAPFVSDRCAHLASSFLAPRRPQWDILPHSGGDVLAPLPA